MSEFQSPQDQPRAASAGAVIGGLLLSIIVGAIGNVIAGLIAMSQSNGPLGCVIGAAPGLLFIVWGALLGGKRSSFGIGLLIGGCVIALLGGACGASMVGTSFK